MLGRSSAAPRRRRWWTLSFVFCSNAIDLADRHRSVAQVWPVLESALRTREDIIDTRNTGDQSLKSATNGMFSFGTACAAGCYLLTGTQQVITLADSATSAVLSTVGSRHVLGRGIFRETRGWTAKHWGGRLDPSPDSNADDVVDVDPLTANEADGLAAADNIPTVAQLCVGARVHDHVIGDTGTVRQTSVEGGGKVLVEYDDKSASHGQQIPLWRTVSDGHVVLLRA